MLFERILSAGLAHYSYLIGDGDQAVVIDPRRDVEVYVERTAQAGLRITHILETHRNEDYVIGSRELAERTGARILHSAHTELPFGYGEPLRDGDRLHVGPYVLQALHTPGHTPGHLSYILHEPQGAPWMAFCGDALFAGDVGRVDLVGRERIREMAGYLYESIFARLLPLGDGVILCPAHGAGSACGAAIADRPWTTIGLERRLNPRLQHTTREGFVNDVAQVLEYPPYFAMMEKVNQEGPPLLGHLPAPVPLAPEEFAERAGEAQVLDTRSIFEFSAAHLPGALSIWQEGVPRYAGWYLSYERPILLVCDGDNPEQTVRYLIRLGYDNLAGYLAGGMLGWHRAGRDSLALPTVTVQGVCRRLDQGDDLWILDVRSPAELRQEGRIPGAHSIHITQLPQHLDEVPRDRPVFIFCGSGLRSMIGASLLQRSGWRNVSVVLGGMTGWISARFPIQKEAAEPAPQPA